MDAPHYHSHPPTSLAEVIGQRGGGCVWLQGIEGTPPPAWPDGKQEPLSLMETNYPAIRVVRAEAGDTKVSVCV